MVRGDGRSPPRAGCRPTPLATRPTDTTGFRPAPRGHRGGRYRWSPDPCSANRMLSELAFRGSGRRIARGVSVSTRLLHKTSGRSRNEAREVLEFFFLAELLSPSRCLWIVSPWLRDVTLFDN